MGTEPHKGILDRDLAAVNSKDLIETAGPLLRELVNFSTMVLVRCDRSASGGEDEDTAVMSLFRKAIVWADGVERLVSSCCFEAAIPLTRSLFECTMQIKYILSDEETYVRRSLAWFTWFLMQQVKFVDQFDEESDSGRGLLKECGADDISMDEILKEDHDPTAERAVYKAALEKPHIAPIYEEFRQGRGATATGRGRPYRNWFQIDAGPENLFELARVLKMVAQYRIVYRLWSDDVHGTGKLVIRPGEDCFVFDPVRYPDRPCKAAIYTAVALIGAIQGMIEAFRPGEVLRRWYESEIMQLLHGILDMK